MQSNIFPYDYSILDPTGNITALVESSVEPCRQPIVAEALMRLHPEVEQVGFVRFDLSNDSGDAMQGELRMAGGEFCGNASMSAAVLCAARVQEAGRRTKRSCTVCLSVSGAAAPIEVQLEKAATDRYRATLEMPPVLRIEEHGFFYAGQQVSLPLLRMEGISHVIIEENSVFFRLLDDRGLAEQLVREWCAKLGSDGLGLMFLKGSGLQYEMTPLVCIPVSGTVFWEHSCASGSAAVGLYMARKTGSPISIDLREPGGILHVESDPGSGRTRLSGMVRLTV